jgi:hypothetical protein
MANCDVCGSKSDRVVVEVMPDYLRDSHRAAGNWGNYPLNGAERLVMQRSEAEALCESDADEYNHIVRDASDSDLDDYEVVS